MKKNKYFLMGIILFGLVAIVTTTFATFVITGGQNHVDIDEGPNVSIGEVQSNIVDLTATMSKSNMKVDAKAGDNEGRVTASADSAEDLTVSIALTVKGVKTDWQNVKITVNFGSNTDSEKDLLVLDSSMNAANNVITISKEAFTSGSDEAGWTLTKEIIFDYGAATDNQNPSVYLDTNEVWKDKDGGKTAQEVEIELRRLLGLYDGIQITFDVDVTPAQTA